MLYYQVSARCFRQVFNVLLLPGQILMALGMRVGIWGLVRQFGEQVAFFVVRAKAAFLLFEAVQLKGHSETQYYKVCAYSNNKNA